MKKITNKLIVPKTLLVIALLMVSIMLFPVKNANAFPVEYYTSIDGGPSIIKADTNVMGAAFGTSLGLRAGLIGLEADVRFGFKHNSTNYITAFAGPAIWIKSFYLRLLWGLYMPYQSGVPITSYQAIAPGAGITFSLGVLKIGPDYTLIWEYDSLDLKIHQIMLRIYLPF